MGPAAPARAAVFDFESVPLGTPTPFSTTLGGITATFSSPGGDPGGFAVAPSFFTTMTGRVLLDPGPSGRAFIPLVAGFDQPLSDVSLRFATDDVGQPFSTFRLEAFSGGVGGTLVGTADAVGTLQASGFPEGQISFDGGGVSFDTLRFTTVGQAPFFAVDDINVTPSPVPEPGSLTLSVLGGFGLLGYAWRRRGRAPA
jgi:hypothetical protein